MKLHRQNYHSYLFSLAPWLYLGVFAQIFVYHHYFEATLVTEIAYFLVFGISIAFILFWGFFRFQEVIVHPNYVQVKMRYMELEREVLFSDIKTMEVQKKKNFGSVVMTLKSGEIYKIFHLDSPELLVKAHEIKRASSF